MTPEREQIEQLVKEAQNGSVSAFETLYDKFSPALYGVICKIVKSDEVGEDLLQDTFVKIWKNIGKYSKNKGTIFTWMLNIARNTSIDYIRKAKNKPKSDIQTIDYSVDMSNGRQDKIKTDHIGLKEFVENLSEDQQIIIEYIYFNGYTQQEVSDELGIPLGTVKSRSRLAINNLKKVFNSLLFWI